MEERYYATPWFLLEKEIPSRPYENYAWEKVMWYYTRFGDRYLLAEAIFSYCETGNLTNKIREYGERRIMRDELVLKEVMPHTLFEFLYKRLPDVSSDLDKDILHSFHIVLHVPRFLKRDASSFVFYDSLCENNEEIYEKNDDGIYYYWSKVHLAEPYGSVIGRSKKKYYMWSDSRKNYFLTFKYAKGKKFYPSKYYVKYA
jgi:hypothetical protein